MYQAEAVIVSTGAQSLMLGLEAEPRLLGHGLSTCATCDGFFFRGQRDRRRRRRRLGDRGGDVPHQVRRQGHADPPPRHAAGLEDHAGPGLRQPEDRVPVEHRRRRPRRRRHARAAPSSRNVETGETSTLPVTGLFVAIGHRPNTDLFTGVLDMDENGYLVTAARLDVHQRRRRVRLRRRAGPHLPPGDHRRRLGLHGGDRRRALARGHVQPRADRPSPSDVVSSGRCPARECSRRSHVR